MSKQMLNEQTFTAANIQRVDAGTTRSMTVGGVAGKTFLLLAITLVCAAVGWSRAETVADGSPLLLLGGFLLLIGLSIAAARNPKLAPIAGFAYALIMGFWVGAISKIYNDAYDGIVTQALLATVGAFTAMLVLYTTRIVKVTNRMIGIIMGATFGVMLLYVFSFVLAIFGAQPSFLTDSSPLGIAVSVGICVIAALNLLVDFSFIERGVAAQAPAVYEWYSALSLLSTMVWLYLEVLRLLGRIQGR
ncbi:MAG: Bax inhibitor-1/YccA family protein [Actinomycetes bacterium]